MSNPTTRPFFLHGKKVSLRPILKEDLERILIWINDPEVREYLASHLPIDEYSEEKWIEGLHEGQPHDIILAIETHDGVHIGNMGIHRIDYLNGVAWTGALIGNKDYWGKGYGTEAKMLLLHYAFMTLNMRKMCSTVFEFNERSRAYLAKTGYVEEGCLKKQRYRGGRYWDEIYVSLFKEDWLPIWEEYEETHLS